MYCEKKRRRVYIFPDTVFCDTFYLVHQRKHGDLAHASMFRTTRAHVPYCTVLALAMPACAAMQEHLGWCHLHDSAYRVVALGAAIVVQGRGHRD
jgi:hypothetical protein